MISIVKRYTKAVFDPIVGEVLMLHSVTKHRNLIPNDKIRYSLTPEMLIGIIEDYRSKSYQFITIDEVSKIVRYRKKPKQKLVCFTFDDGYADNYYEAYPILKEYNVPFTIYLSQNYSMLTKDALLTEKQIVELSRESLCTIGAHTSNHLRLTKLSEDVCRQEILDNKNYLELLLEKEIKHFSYPYGDSNEKVAEIVKSIGFEAATNAWGGGFRLSSNPFLIPRRALFYE